jgi:alpha-ketoglutarate-dependent taurine dioxygenase
MLTFTPTGAALGSICTGLAGLTTATEADLEEIQAHLRSDLLVVLRGMNQSTITDFRDFARRFGELNQYYRPGQWNDPSAPEVLIFSNLPHYGNLAGSGPLDWHSNNSYCQRVAQYALLYGVRTPAPERGGATKFADLQAAYEALDSQVKELIDGLEVLRSVKKTIYKYSDLKEAAGDPIPSGIGPLVRQNERTGRRTLYDVGATVWVHILGMSVDDSERLRKQLFEHATQPRFRYDHRWQQGDLIIWDNVSTLHGRDGFDAAETRLCWELDIKDEVATVRPLHSEFGEKV